MSGMQRCGYDNHHWFEAVRSWPILEHLDPFKQSSILYDLWLSISSLTCSRWKHCLSRLVGRQTLVDDSESPSTVTNWRDKDAFLDLVTQRLIGGAL